ncbi:MAG: glycoside hydrolase family 2 protein [Bacteroidales bacterium]|jgi:beta-mannosidase|nr:glycoside hydrolase family 2 protein [Bacteroidales bacterium]
MKKLFATALFLFAFSSVWTQVYRMELNNGWTFRQNRGVNTYPATVPGVVHTDLMNNGIIEDPFFRMNERAVQWVDKEDWIYTTTFNLSREIMAKDSIRLVFKGLDVYADVYINDTLVLKTDNMFHEWIVSRKDLLKEGENELRVYFHSPLKIDIPKFDALPFRYEAGNDQSRIGGVFDKQVSIFARKAPYHYGWDWGPRLVTMGIWRPVYIEAWNVGRIEDVWVRNRSVSAKSATLSVDVELNMNAQQSGSLRVLNAETGEVYTTTTVNVGARHTSPLTMNFTIKNPKLWWSNGLGEQYLYPIKVVLESNGKILDEQTKNIGVRSLRLVCDKDKDGKGTSFYFELNGHPVFMKGANYIPLDNFLPRVTRERYETMILNARDANLNMLRVWGGGIYEDDMFYELCDKYGILVWQDFMFACSLYPADSAMLESVLREATYNVKRLRNHPSLALWCGNNEMQDAFFTWGWKRRHEQRSPEGTAERLWGEYRAIFLDLLPEVVNAYDPQTAYWPSSPLAHWEAEAQSYTEGCVHYWSVFHDREPIAAFAWPNRIPRFMSEFGFQSFPTLPSVKKYAPYERDWDITSEVMLMHQRHPRGNQLIKSFMGRYYRVPEDFETFLYMSQVLQADAMRVGMEAHRRNMPYCMGSLYWQLNDCWPVASWSSVDFYNDWKALHHFARNIFEPVLVSPYETNDTLTVHVVSDRLQAFRADLIVQILDFSGNIIFERKQQVSMPANTSRLMFSMPTEAMLKGKSRNDVFVHVTLEEKGKMPISNTYYLALQKDVNFPKTNIVKSVKPAPNGFELTLNSDKLARAVFLSIGEPGNFFNDNFFDLIPKKPKTIHVRTTLSQREFEQRLKIMMLNEI